MPGTEKLPDACRPRLAPGVRLQPDPFTNDTILIYPEAITQLKGPGPAIVSLCTGDNTLAQIISTLAQQYNAPPEKLLADVTTYLHRLIEKRLLEIHDTPAPAKRVDIPINAPTPIHLPNLPRPMGLIAELTYTCPLHCPYCSNPTQYPAGTELSTEDWSRVLRQAASIGILHALFSGGEPLTRKDLEHLITAARSAGLYTNLITSAVGLSATRLASLQSAGLDSIQISFQSDQAPLANSIAGTNAHDLKLAAAHLVRNSGIPLTLNVVLHRHNIDRLPHIIALAESLGARRLELAHTQFYGTAFKNRDHLLPSRDQITRAQSIAAEATQRLRGTIDILYVLPDYFGDFPKPCMNGWAQRYIAINPVGSALPCPTAAEIPHLHFDNVQEKSLDWIWQHSEPFNRFRGTAWMPEPCQSCDRRTIDFGGCRCQAALLTGNATNTDPTCTRSPHHRLITTTLTQATTPRTRSLESLLYRQNP